MSDYDVQWRAIFSRQTRGTIFLLLHILLVPVGVYLVGWFLARTSGKDPVWFYVAGFAYFIFGLIHIVVRYNAFRCPRCNGKVKAWNRYNSPSIPVPCPKCGLVRPLISP